MIWPIVKLVFNMGPSLGLMQGRLEQIVQPGAQAAQTSRSVTRCRIAHLCPFLPLQRCYEKKSCEANYQYGFFAFRTTGHTRLSFIINCLWQYSHRKQRRPILKRIPNQRPQPFQNWAAALAALLRARRCPEGCGEPGASVPGSDRCGAGEVRLLAVAGATGCTVCW